MKQIRCENCGANIEITSNNNRFCCPYCRSKYTLSDEEREITNSQNAAKSNSIPTQEQALERPKINVGLAIFLFFVYWPIGVIYIAVKTHKQKKWDEEHNKKD